MTDRGDIPEVQHQVGHVLIGFAVLPCPHLHRHQLIDSANREHAWGKFCALGSSALRP